MLLNHRLWQKWVRSHNPPDLNFGTLTNKIIRSPFSKRRLRHAVFRIFLSPSLQPLWYLYIYVFLLYFSCVVKPMERTMSFISTPPGYINEACWYFAKLNSQCFTESESYTAKLYFMIRCVDKGNTLSKLVQTLEFQEKKRRVFFT